jgi:two-component system cell cycle response regulator CpdR
MEILIAEDERLIAESYRLVLESVGHKVTLTYDGQECIATYEKRKASTASGLPDCPSFDLIILDYRMPKKNGLEVASNILLATPNQRIILATAYAHDLAVAEMQRNGVTASVEVIQKPFEFDYFLKVVEREEKGISKHDHGRTQPDESHQSMRLTSGTDTFEAPASISNDSDWTIDRFGSVMGIWP